MKVKTSQFRSMIKESIKELIEEGVFRDVVKECVQEMISEGTIQSAIASDIDQREAMDRDHGLIKNTHLEKNVSNIAKATAMGKDSKMVKIYEEIYADTAQTTLPKMMSAQLQGGLGGQIQMPVTQEQKKMDQAELDSFGSAGRWAKVAFSNKKSSGI